MDDFIHRLKEKNSNFLNILNNNHANEIKSIHTQQKSSTNVTNNINNRDSTFLNQNTKHLAHENQKQKENEAKILAETKNNLTAGTGSGSYIKAILTKHKITHAAKIPSETAASLAMAALNLTNAAKITLSNENQVANFNNSSYNSLLPNIHVGSDSTTALVTGISNNNKTALITSNKLAPTISTTAPSSQPKSASFHKSLMPKYSSSTLFKLNNFKSHFQFNKNY